MLTEYIPTRSEIADIPSILNQIEDEVIPSFKRKINNVEEVWINAVRVVGGIEWEGDSAEKARMFAARNRRIVGSWAEGCHDAIRKMRGVLNDVWGAYYECLYAIRDAERAGFIVAEDLSMRFAGQATKETETEAVSYSKLIEKSARYIVSCSSFGKDVFTRLATSIADLQLPQPQRLPSPDELRAVGANIPRQPAEMGGQHVQQAGFHHNLKTDIPTDDNPDKTPEQDQEKPSSTAAARDDEDATHDPNANDQDRPSETAEPQDEEATSDPLAPDQNRPSETALPQQVVSPGSSAAVVPLSPLVSGQGAGSGAGGLSGPLSGAASAVRPPGAGSVRPAASIGSPGAASSASSVGSVGGAGGGPVSGGSQAAPVGPVGPVVPRAVPVGFPVTEVNPGPQASPPDVPAVGEPGGGAAGGQPPVTTSPDAGRAPDGAGGGGVPQMMPPPPSNPPASPPVSSAGAVAGGAVPPVPAGHPSAGGGVDGLLSNLNPYDKARHQLLANTRGRPLADFVIAGHKLCEQLTAWSAKQPFLEWAVGGVAAGEDDPAMLFVSSNIGLGFIPAKAFIPNSPGIGHVFAAGDEFPWPVKIPWLGDPIRAVVGFGNAIGRPVSMVAARQITFDGTVIDLNTISCEVTSDTPDEPEGYEYSWPRERLRVVDPGKARAIETADVSGLLAGLPAAVGPEVEPDKSRRMDLWTRTFTARDEAISRNLPQLHLLAWRAFCVDQANTSVYRLKQLTETAHADANTDSRIRKHLADYSYFIWNITQTDQALSTIAPQEPAA